MVFGDALMVASCTGRGVWLATKDDCALCFAVGCSQWLNAVGGEAWAADLRWLLWWWSRVSGACSTGQWQRERTK